MSGRTTSLAGKRRSSKKAPGKKPNARRQRQLALKKRRYKESALYARRLARAEAAKASETESSTPES